MYEATTNEEVLAQAEKIIDYYRTNPQCFVEDCLHINARLFQNINIAMMDWAQTSVIIGARGIGKSYLIAIYACFRAILYPGSKIVIASYKRGQSINVLEKIIQELVPNSPELKAEIEKTQINGTIAMISFKNTSTIKVVTAGESARSNRATLLIVDEYRQVKKETIDTILKKFLTQQRMPAYLDLSKGERTAEYNKEVNKTVYLSSAFFKDHWSYTKFKDTYNNMLAGARQFTCALPYELSIAEGLLNPATIEDEMSETDFSEFKFDMEYSCIWYGGADDAFFVYDTIAKCRTLRHVMLPDKLSIKLGSAGSTFRIVPKKPGELRLLSADIALMSSTKHNNDASAIFVNQMMPTKNGRYMNNIIYTTSSEGLRTDDQALEIRKLYNEFECDYIILDTSGLGLGVFDCLARDMVDPDTGEVYPALSCCNNADMAARCTVQGADKVIWAIKANAQFNSDCAYLLRDAFSGGKLRLPISEYDAEDILSDVKGYSALNPPERLQLQMPYINTTLLVDELIKLQYETNNGKIKIIERSNMRKDRYSSLSYNYYVAKQLENRMLKRYNSTHNDKNIFIIKPPQTKGKAVNRNGRHGI